VPVAGGRVRESVHQAEQAPGYGDHTRDVQPGLTRDRRRSGTSPSGRTVARYDIHLRHTFRYSGNGGFGCEPQPAIWRYLLRFWEVFNERGLARVFCMCTHRALIMPHSSPRYRHSALSSIISYTPPPPAITAARLGYGPGWAVARHQTAGPARAGRIGTYQQLESTWVMTIAHSNCVRDPAAQVRDIPRETPYYGCLRLTRKVRVN
jgi:hypothetical protein